MACQSSYLTLKEDLLREDSILKLHLEFVHSFTVRALTAIASVESSAVARSFIAKGITIVHLTIAIHQRLQMVLVPFHPCKGINQIIIEVTTTVITVRALGSMTKLKEQVATIEGFIENDLIAVAEKFEDF